METGLSFINLRRKLEKHKKIVLEIDETINYLNRLENHLKGKGGSKLTIQDERLNDFLSDSLPKTVLKNEGQMFYWIEATGKSREELERLKNEV